MKEQSMDQKQPSPWTFDQVKMLIKRQKNEKMHPYTCSGNGHTAELIPTPNGLVCPVCNKIQTWCHKADVTKIKIMEYNSIRDFSPMEAILYERGKQIQKWGQQDHNDYKWLTILGEEFGESAKAILDSDKNLEYELVQVAAVCVAWIECIRKRKKEKKND